VRIRSGAVDLRPRLESGWYDHQVYALETLLLPEKGAERDKLLLTKAYKKRMLEAFQALLTKRRETHVRQLMAAKAHAMARPSEVTPRRRVEPCPTYYLRTARAYSCLANFLDAAVGQDGLGKLHGLKEGGERPADFPRQGREQAGLFRTQVGRQRGHRLAAVVPHRPESVEDQGHRAGGVEPVASGRPDALAAQVRQEAGTGQVRVAPREREQPPALPTITIRCCAPSARPGG